MQNFYPFAQMPTVALIDQYERRAIYCENNGYHKLAAKHWQYVEAGEDMRRKAGFDIYQERENK